MVFVPFFEALNCKCSVVTHRAACKSAVACLLSVASRVRCVNAGKCHPSHDFELHYFRQKKKYTFKVCQLVFIASFNIELESDFH